MKGRSERHLCSKRERRGVGGWSGNGRGGKGGCFTRFRKRRVADLGRGKRKTGENEWGSRSPRNGTIRKRAREGKAGISFPAIQKESQ